MAPDVLILGQIVVDDVVPAAPGGWQRQVGGNALYAAAGARLWNARVGIVARLGSDFPLDVRGLLQSVGLETTGLVEVDRETLTEWILYETDGQRQSMPRNWRLRDPAADTAELQRRYFEHLGGLSAEASDIPAAWRSTLAVHLAPQVGVRHQESCAALSGRFISVDPSPHYARGLSALELGALLRGATAFLPSQAEVQHLLEQRSESEAVDDLHAAGFEEVVIKLGARGTMSRFGLQPAAAAKPVDLTGAGDSFGGAYAACRALGLDAAECIRRASVAASLVVETSGADAALRIDPQRAWERLAAL